MEENINALAEILNSLKRVEYLLEASVKIQVQQLAATRGDNEQELVKKVLLAVDSRVKEYVEGLGRSQ